MTVYEIRTTMNGHVYVTFVCPLHYATRTMASPTMLTEYVRGPIKVDDAQCGECYFSARKSSET